MANASEVCYDNIGCFSNAWPFWNTFGILPNSPEQNGITFHLYTRINPTNDQVLDPNGSGTSVMSTNFNGAHKTVFIIHGFNGEIDDDWIKLMTTALIQYFDVNVIVVVWTDGANDNYFQAVANTRVVGAVIANMIKLLQRSGGLTLNNVHLVGHSLGAHVAGYVGEIITGMGRITGLDPAGPAFYTANVKVRLDSSDATFVDVIHTDGVLGLQKNMGHADFYPNGGKIQPGCLTDPIAPVYSCAHMRALYYFIESVNPDCKFTSELCQSWDDFKDGNCESCGSGCQEMGYNLAYNADGEYYLRTGQKYPYCDY
ncbi:Phospholipase A1 member A,Endothelial lipase,Pancreatic lipase-related protein 2,Inactive pancreatic lipase-related protein 1,Pancreatic triacylglycerol lipase,Putative endothelial lipase [Mytilus coruscus]|uniref:Phospholipase A1 member A,Endothelial lipase,Pancreatic lipase-related protein 2,Inactive pancreatic lipase-related protein 1,Pancreatic triacylglycerol lipase,Putative endothelial lipase n=1 Tax=Mytilus coruscus TaxID=42192 RepID=A0A6J8B0H4_MYTCO|nr:Phospholipase A1 member A,Endothelial lipase,Pancreatic lipase-related protein 2,Inactive pancreatic lipase-related protein 1,Pancreatic triacylglycerol lipase,Putative endothelial lipase [Mytilus coruscus]